MSFWVYLVAGKQNYHFNKQFTCFSLSSLYVDQNRQLFKKNASNSWENSYCMFWHTNTQLVQKKKKKNHKRGSRQMLNTTPEHHRGKIKTSTISRPEGNTEQSCVHYNTQGHNCRFQASPLMQQLVFNILTYSKGFCKNLKSDISDAILNLLLF